jgi:hypothetical protein
MRQGDYLLRPAPLQNIGQGIGAGDKEPLGLQAREVDLILRPQITQRVYRISGPIAININPSHIEPIVH